MYVSVIVVLILCFVVVVLMLHSVNLFGLAVARFPFGTGDPLLGWHSCVNPGTLFLFAVWF